MEHEKFDIPHNIFNLESSPSRLTIHKTPVRNNDRKERRSSSANELTGFSLLPSHITPPSGLTKFIARNPFEANLTSRLHLSVMSPTVFTKGSSMLQLDSPGFSWSVDDLANLRPAKIEEFPLQHMHCTDPEIEKEAQAAIDKFFTKEQIIPSPWDEGRSARTDMMTPTRPVEDFNLTREMHKNQKKEGWSQTILSLPPVLPPEVEEALKPYFTFHQDQNVESEESNSSNSSLRRKLFFNHDDNCTDDDDDDEDEPSSPCNLHGSMIIISSPPGSGMHMHGTPLRRRSFGLRRTHGTPHIGNLTPNMSPITCNDTSYQSVRSRFAARLDFTTDMSVDASIRDDKELKPIEDLEHDINTSLLHSNVIDDRQEIPRKIEEHGDNYQSECHNDTAEMLSRDITPMKRDKAQEIKIMMTRKSEILDGLKLSSEWFRTNSDESYPQQNNTLLGHSGLGQASDVNSAQDTGYQTYSMSNITGNDNCSIEPTKKSFNWNEKILSNNDEIRLSDWQENMINMFSSTPSKYSRRKDN